VTADRDATLECRYSVFLLEDTEDNNEWEPDAEVYEQGDLVSVIRSQSYESYDLTIEIFYNAGIVKSRSED
jgi:hypothetical protein